MTPDPNIVNLILAMMDGSGFANAVRNCGRPCRVPLPVKTEERRVLVAAHLAGAPMELTFDAECHEPWREHVSAVALAAICPASDALCRWIGIDLDGADHGERGLEDPAHAARVIAERADAAGLTTGTLVARSRGGRGQHVFLLLPEPVGLPDAVIAVAALAASAFKVASRDVAEYKSLHAFRRANGEIAHPGDIGAVELIPRSTVHPPYGWCLALPAAGAFAAVGGGVIVNPFDDRPLQLERVPRCNEAAWSRFVQEARAAWSRRNATAPAPPTKHRQPHAAGPRSTIDRLDPRTRAFLDGLAKAGTRNVSAFSASANLLGCGFDKNEAEQLVLAGAAACGLPEREARAAFSSALTALTRKGKLA